MFTISRYAVTIIIIDRCGISVNNDTKWSGTDAYSIPGHKKTSIFYHTGRHAFCNYKKEASLQHSNFKVT